MYVIRLTHEYYDDSCKRDAYLQVWQTFLFPSTKAMEIYIEEKLLRISISILTVNPPHLLVRHDWSVGWLHITSDYILKIRKYKELQIDFLNDE